MKIKNANGVFLRIYINRSVKKELFFMKAPKIYYATLLGLAITSALILINPLCGQAAVKDDVATIQEPPLTTTEKATVEQVVYFHLTQGTRKVKRHIQAYQEVAIDPVNKKRTVSKWHLVPLEEISIPHQPGYKATSLLPELTDIDDLTTLSRPVHIYYESANIDNEQKRQSADNDITPVSPSSTPAESQGLGQVSQSAAPSSTNQDPQPQISLHQRIKDAERNLDNLRRLTQQKEEQGAKRLPQTGNQTDNLTTITGLSLVFLTAGINLFVLKRNQ